MVTIAHDPRLLVQTIEEFGRLFVAASAGVYQVQVTQVGGEFSVVVLVDPSASPSLPDRFHGLPVIAIRGTPGTAT